MESAVSKSDQTFVSPRPPAPEVHAIASPDGDGHLFVVDAAYRVEHRPGPKARRRAHTFDDLGSFATYLKRHADPMRTEILMGEDQVIAGLDPRCINGDVVTCKLVLDERFQAWSAAFGKPLRQKAMYALIRAQRGDLLPEVAGMLISALRSITVTSGGELRSELAETGATVFVAKSSKREITGELPASFYVQIPVFEGLAIGGGAEQLYPIEAFLYMEIEEKTGPVYLLDVPTLPAVVRSARRDAAQFLESLLGAGEKSFQVGLGTFGARDVPAYSGLSENAKAAEADRVTRGDSPNGSGVDGHALPGTPGEAGVVRPIAA